MKALVYSAFGELPELTEVPDPVPAADGVVVRVAATGVCRSDWHGWIGHDPVIQLPHVPGHELSGTIEAVGKTVRHWSVGDRVTVPFAAGCGTCPTCADGDPHICADQFQPGFTGWGSFAELVALRYADANLVRVPETIAHVTAASLGCRFATAFRAVVDQACVTEGEWLAVHGCGGVGLSAVNIAAACGAHVIGIDVNDEALALAATLGARHVINGSAVSDVAAEIREITDGGAHVSLDALGSATTCYNSIACLRKRGRHIQVGLMLGDHQDPRIPMGAVIADELEVIGSHGMPAPRYGAMLAMIESGVVAPDQLVVEQIALEDAGDALMRMDEFGGVGTRVVVMS